MILPTGFRVGSPLFLGPKKILWSVRVAFLLTIPASVSDLVSDWGNRLQIPGDGEAVFLGQVLVPG